ncbi:MAG: glycosyltransferase [Bacteroidales bacterium]|jgi:glycosyltransferase involved in cell wall biosynthesis|nr:glycosyltransferase [Bacteroidales bacterium]
MIKEENSILVSVCTLTYNHVPYIRQCVESLLMQKTNFDFEILIHDDASTDGNQSIIREYEEKYPQIIKPIYQKENQHSKGVRITPQFQLPRAKGKYIAFCEGDDYWTDELKLQKQVDFLEKNEDYGLVHTDYKVFNQSQNAFAAALFSNPPCGNVFEQLLYSDFICTLTVMARTNLLIPASRSEVFDLLKPKMGDYPLWLFISRHSKIGYINDCTGVYRVLDKSMSHFTDMAKQFAFHLSAWKVSEFFAQGTSQAYWVKFFEQRFVRQWFFRALKANDKSAALSILNHIDGKGIKHYFYRLCVKSDLLKNVALFSVSVKNKICAMRTLQIAEKSKRQKLERLSNDEDLKR